MEEYTITFDAKGGQMPTGYPTVLTVSAGAIVENLPVPTLEGSAFYGWKIEPFYPEDGWDIGRNSLTDKLTTTTPILKDIEVFAMWGN